MKTLIVLISEREGFTLKCLSYSILIKGEVPRCCSSSSSTKIGQPNHPQPRNVEPNQSQPQIEQPTIGNEFVEQSPLHSNAFVVPTTSPSHLPPSIVSQSQANGFPTSLPSQGNQNLVQVEGTTEGGDTSTHNDDDPPHGAVLEMIEPCNDGFYPSRVTSKAITKTIKQHYVQPWPTWGAMSDEEKDVFFQRFKASLKLHLVKEVPNHPPCTLFRKKESGIRVGLLLQVAKIVKEGCMGLEKSVKVIDPGIDYQNLAMNYYVSSPKAQKKSRENPLKSPLKWPRERPIYRDLKVLRLGCQTILIRGRWGASSAARGPSPSLRCSWGSDLVTYLHYVGHISSSRPPFEVILVPFES
ncbi:hypothetical protein Fmac_024804 [Flemingia macrophylla]|uniref:Uncharacterized protein n=1 Tax=Flemingia macrophylla TaxID=520843 RepID=A0ABD1LQJ0_9FABA